MSNFDGDEASNKHRETSADRSSDKKEVVEWEVKEEEIISSVHEPETIIVRDGHGDTRSRYDRSQHIGTTVTTSSLGNETVVTTHSADETRRYIESLGSSVFVSERPEIIYRPPAECILPSEQRVILRCLQPPRPPSPEPLIIKKVPAEPSPPLPPIIVREFPRRPASPPPIVLRERPPTPPPRLPSETVISRVPGLPPPPRSIIVERFPTAPERQPDIIIERWLPYGAPPPRRRIVQESPSTIVQYPQPYHRIIVCKDVRLNTTQKIERQGIVPEDPNAYIARYGSSLLDRVTLEHHARNAGVTGDISCVLLSSSTNVTTQGTVVNCEELLRQGYLPSGGISNESITRVTGGERTSPSSRIYSSSASHYYS